MLWSMWLPTPTEQSVKEFQDLVRLELGIELNYDQARASATRLLHLYFYKTYGCSYLRAQIDRE